MNGLPMLLCHFQCFRTLAGHEDSVSILSQVFSRGRTHRFFVLYQENRLVTAEWTIPTITKSSLDRFFHSGQIYLEGRALAPFTLHENVTRTLPHDAEYGSQSKARSSPLFLS